MSATLQLERKNLTPPVPTGPLQLLIIQPTPFCNLDCKYCYLPDRLNPKRIKLETVDGILRRVFASGIVTQPFDLAWHSGEPLVVPLSFYEEAFALARKYDPEGKVVRQYIQTNATLVTPEWCDFFKRHNVILGVSIDGPEFLHDKNRVNRRGEGTHKRVMAGVRLLQENGVPFSVISVLTDESLDCPDELYDFYSRAGITRVAFNVEEQDGANLKSSLNTKGIEQRFKRFLSRFYDLVELGEHRIYVREIDPAMSNIVFEEKLGTPNNPQVTPFGITCFDYDGNVSGYSPEFLGMKNAAFHDYLFGDAKTELTDSLSKPGYQLTTEAIAKGVKRCAESCEYFKFCGGGAPSNKLGENGTFDSTETLNCRLGIKVKIDVMREKYAERRPFVNMAQNLKKAEAQNAG